MNDRFKFRVFYKPHNTIYNVICLNSDRQKEIIIEYKDSTALVEWKDCDILQCTGLKDKNGKLIYEGDIIVMPNQYPFYDQENKGEYKLNYVGIVEWIHSQWQYVYHCVNSNIRGISDGINNGLNDYGWDENENTEYLILGNIYENKELLNERN